MGPLDGGRGDISSPIQKHQTQIINDLFCAKGALQSMGGPHDFINRDGIDVLEVNDAYVAPWSYTGLPSSQTPQLFINREKVQFLIFTEQESLDLYRKPPRTERVMLYFPLFVVQGEIPILSEAKASNFLDFWKGIFVPLGDASIHFLAEGPLRLPSQAPLVYVNRQQIQGYFQIA
ncbi:MAG: hypothetical protein RBT47_06455 [Anaerolineae bacterium]|jgi:hypothetical protein|nr:hypothetical protein [Anaerolineae bacterium]